VRGQRDDLPRKPDPAAARAIAEALGVVPERCVYLGDSDVDMQTARAAGMVAIGATWGFRSEAELRQAGADHMIDTPGELLTLLGDEHPEPG
jgi:phosphoglycolate phosphatase